MVTDSTYIAKLYKLSEISTIRLICQALKDTALSWLSSTFPNPNEIVLEDLLKKLEERFSCKHKVLQLLGSFISSEKSTDAEAFIKYCRMGDYFVERGVLNYSSALPFVLKKSPESLKSTLYYYSCNCQDWSGFLRRAEEIAWIAFPNFKNLI